MEVSEIKQVGETRKATRADIDSQIDAFLNPPTEMGAHAAVAGSDDPTTPDEKLTLDLATIWPIVKSIFAFVRPFLFFSKKWRDILDRFIAGIDVMIPAVD